MDEGFGITLEQVHDYQFVINFGDDGVPALVTDERAPLGGDTGPSPSRLLAAAVANCLAASLLFAARKFRNQPDPLRASAKISMARNAQGRWRIADIAVELNLGVDKSELVQMERVLAQFEDFCVVTASVRQGIPISVQVRDGHGELMTPAQG